MRPAGKFAPTFVSFGVLHSICKNYIYNYVKLKIVAIKYSGLLYDKNINIQIVCLFLSENNVFRNEIYPFIVARSDSVTSSA